MRTKETKVIRRKGKLYVIQKPKKRWSYSRCLNFINQLNKPNCGYLIAKDLSTNLTPSPQTK